MSRTPCCVVSFALVAALLTEAQAGGIFLPGAGAQAQGRAGAFVAKADDPSAMLHNPAGVAKGHGTIIHFGVNLVDLSLAYTRAGSYEQPSGANLPYAGQAYPRIEDESSPAFGIGGFQALPLIAVTTDFGIETLPVRFGFGLLAPQAYPLREFAPDFDPSDANAPPPPQRYDTMKQEGVSIMPSIAVAYTALDGRLSVGARGTWGVTELEATSYAWGVRNYEEWIERDAVFTAKVSDRFVPSAALGLLYRISPSVEIGAAWNSAMKISAKGTGTAVLGADLGTPGMPAVVEPELDSPACEGGGTREALKTCVNVTLPQTATIGARWIVRNEASRAIGDVELDVRWEQWSAADEQRVVVDGKTVIAGTERELGGNTVRHGFQDVVSIRLGGSWSIPAAGNWLTFRAGVAYDTATAPTSWNRLDIDSKPRTTIAGGFSYTTKRVRYDIGGGIVLEPSRTVFDCNPTAQNPGCLGNGEDTPVADRVAPDPVQPLTGVDSVESPYNAGRYTSRYILLHVGITTWF